MKTPTYYLSHGGYFKSKEDADNFVNPVPIKDMQDPCIIQWHRTKGYWAPDMPNKDMAPMDNGIPELDALCEQYNAGKINLNALVCRIWNKALGIH